MYDDLLKKLQIWYHSMCDGGWEHYYGIKIDTTDNPGWNVTIDIIDTPLENKPFESFHIGESDDNYFHCFVKNGQFIGVGDVNKLEDIIRVFLNWTEKEDV